MTTSNPTSNPTSAHRPNAPTAYSAEGTQPARVAPRRGSETKAAFKTTEFIAYVVAVVGVLMASLISMSYQSNETLRPGANSGRSTTPAVQVFAVSSERSRLPPDVPCV